MELISFLVRLDANDLKHLKIIAERKRASTATIIREAVVRYLDTHIITQSLREEERKDVQEKSME